MIGCYINGPILTEQYALSLYLVILFLRTPFRKQKTKGIISGGTLRHSATVHCLLGECFLGNRSFTGTTGSFPFSEILCASAG